MVLKTLENTALTKVCVRNPQMILSTLAPHLFLSIYKVSGAPLASAETLALPMYLKHLTNQRAEAVM